MITLKQINNTLRTYKKALLDNSLMKKEKKECLEKIKELENMRKIYENDN